jgi:hypothetical protein
MHPEPAAISEHRKNSVELESSLMFRSGGMSIANNRTETFAAQAVNRSCLTEGQARYTQGCSFGASA